MTHATAEQDNGATDRQTLLRRGQYVELASLTHNTLEVVVSLAAGFATGSSSLVSYGLDSTIEFFGTGSTLWTLHGEAKGAGEDEQRRRRRRAKPTRPRTRRPRRRGVTHA